MNMDTLPALDGLMTLEEVAVAINGSRRKVEDAIRRGDLTLVKLGARCSRIARDAKLKTYLAKEKGRERVVH